MKQWRLIISTSLGVMICSGCCHLPSGSRSAQSQTLSPAVAADYAYVKSGEFVCQETDTETNHLYSVEKVQLGGIGPSLVSTRTNRPLVLDYYLPLHKEKSPVLLILPMLGGSYPLEKYFAVYFAKRGFASIIVHREKLRKDSSMAALDFMLKQSVLDNMRAIDWIETRPELDAERIGVFGISMGGIKGALLAPLEHRVRAAILGLAGGDLPYILTYTTENGLAKRRDAILRDEHLTLEELHEKLRQGLSCDPNTLAPFVDPQRVLLVLGAFDSVVPSKKGLELRSKMGKPETIVVPTGHYSAILFLPYIQHQSYKFFQRKLTRPREQARAANRH